MLLTCTPLCRQAFEASLQRMMEGNMTLVDELGSVQLAIQGLHQLGPTQCTAAACVVTGASATTSALIYVMVGVFA